MTYLSQALQSGKLAGNGPFGKACCAWLQDQVGSKKAFLTPSCTSALEMSALLLDLQPGDEVILPSFTFVSTACAFAIFGVRPVFVDVRPDTLCLDASQLVKAISGKTRAIVPVHYAGVASPMDEINAVAKEHGLRVIEDNAHGLTATYHGKQLGSLGDMATVSFHETKNFSAGEGGALLVNDPELVERAEIMQEKGTNRSRFLLGQIDKYTWVDRGSSYLLGELPAAVLLANLQARDVVQPRRVALWERYQRELGGWAQRHGVTQPTVPPGCTQPGHLYYLLMRNSEERRVLLERLRARQILATSHYVPLHLSPMGQNLGRAIGVCPVSVDAADRMIRLPLYAEMSEEQQNRVIEAVTE